MGASSSTPARETSTTQVERLNEKLAVFRKDNDVLAADKPDALELGESLTIDVLDKWSKDFENVSNGLIGDARLGIGLTAGPHTLAVALGPLAQRRAADAREQNGLDPRCQGLQPVAQGPERQGRVPRSESQPGEQRTMLAVRYE